MHLTDVPRLLVAGLVAGIFHQWVTVFVVTTVLDNVSREEANGHPDEGIYLSLLKGVQGRRVGIPGEKTSQKTLEGKSFSVLGLSPAHAKEVNNQKENLGMSLFKKMKHGFYENSISENLTSKNS